MSTERLVKWSKEAQEFFEKAEDNSLVLDIVISYGCKSQTGEEFEDLINSINREEIKKKVKKVNITDTAYLYRHCINDCLRYVDKKVATLWYINNKLFIDNLNVEVNLKSWADGISTDTFKHWHKQIVLDYNGDEEGKGIDREFRELIISDASVAAYKGDNNFQQCVDFILEECAYLCANLKNSVIIYPMPFYASINYVITKYKLNLLHLYYTCSRYARRKRHNIEGLKIERDVFPFLVETLNANFFMIDRNGNYIYKNNKLSNIVGDIPANIVAPEVWSVSMEIMKEKKQKVVEELYAGRYYLSVKAPLIINGEVEGVMGLSIDITERKKAEELEKQKELHEIAKGVAHDICSPISALDMVKYVCNDKLGEEERKMFELTIRSIKDISGRLIKKYRNLEDKKYEVDEPESNTEKDYIALYGIRDVVNNKKYSEGKKC
ncbi:MAG: PAS domain S-box protein, partial [Endomicrobium sp.]|nr:PAS domain S-box protein [Endomicrobium sp.]